MQFYQHERQEREPNKASMNTVWPLMSTAGVDIDDTTKYLEGRGLSRILADENGWYPSRHAMDNFLRIVIPALSTKAGHVYWQARAVSAHVSIRYQSPLGKRYGAIVSVRAFPEDVQGELTNEVVIVEGPMDALAAASCGYDSFALMGMEPGEAALDHLGKLVDGRTALVVLDKEPQAQSAAHVIAMRLASLGGQAQFAVPPAKDLAAMAERDRGSWLDDTIEPGWRYL